MGGPAIDVRRAASRFRTDAPGRRTWHSFSFGEHYDPDDVGIGPLLVHNEDRLDPGAGYDEHTHRDAEIVSWLVSGGLAHVDSTGHRGVVAEGGVQRISAGSGVTHAERNDAFRSDPRWPVEAAHLVQVWLRPDHPGGEPSYEQASFDPAALGRGWLAVAAGPDWSSKDRAGLITVDCRGAAFRATRLAVGQRRTVPVADLGHLFVARGAVLLGGPEFSEDVTLAAGDAVRIRGRVAYDIEATADAEVLVWTFEEEDPS